MVVSDFKTYFIIGVYDQKAWGALGSTAQGGETVVRVRDPGSWTLHHGELVLG